ncbi:DUF1285 domain-containing protein [Martelella limonii]|uniref:DUF1285 domain-containing protein n=1 Tax=Martelella limonii TaxID=1647649 RepID=UPI0015810D53|nr:DUF1285 domain-containing protein [Martelella limonii]
MTQGNIAGDAGGLAAAITRQLDGGKLRKAAPVDKWEPEFCGDIDMEIRRDGAWYYQGTPIGRARLAQLFSTVLRKDEDGETYLVTPVEKLRIKVEDAPFLAVGMERDDADTLLIRTNMGDEVAVGDEHPLRFGIGDDDGGVKPYVLVRGRLEALFSRALTYDLMALGTEVEIDGRAMFAIRSGKSVFPVMEMAALEKQV